MSGTVLYTHACRDAVPCVVDYLKEEITLAGGEGGGATLEHGPAARLGHDHAGGVELAVRGHEDGPDVAGPLGELQPS